MLLLVVVCVLVTALAAGNAVVVVVLRSGRGCVAADSVGDGLLLLRVAGERAAQQEVGVAPRGRRPRRAAGGRDRDGDATIAVVVRRRLAVFGGGSAVRVKLVVVMMMLIVRI